MNESTIFKILGQTVRKNADEIAEMPLNTKLSDLGLDSINFIQFIVELEKVLDIEISDSDLVLKNFETIGVLIKTLNKYFIQDCCPLKKVLICDCDNVLWHGIAGEETLTINADVQKFHKELIELYNRGVLLCLCSKNDSLNIMEAFETLNISLKFSFFILSKINMSNKADNIKQISQELNLTTDSFVFMDDSDYELGYVKCVIPDITTIKVNYKNMLFIEELKNCFSSISIVDKNRTQQYREQKSREKDKSRYNNIDEYNRSLNTLVICDFANEGQCKRIAELSQRTNQFNLSGRRYTSENIHNLLINNEHKIITISASDKYGDMGIVGAAIIKTTPNIIIESFFLSCRVFGRNFENIMIEKIKDIYKNKILFGIYNPTEKNKRFSKFYIEHGVCVYE